ncbi:oxidoreductase-like domain-containing protein [Cognatiluteimonas weifangensis]|uniref:Oxidoreductase-like domain-containing protein n=1 Tax=Cognatiluteimonas weifangensis TaxID=2303539 RepID=A0A372DMV2_9GAMM|nr:oxidoreductase-like domain-containing protein [Luteimonas weifangensis]RFP60900.1 hypothetical protein D0Y53_07140 [Luteimonas weifangensis]
MNEANPNPSTPAPPADPPPRRPAEPDPADCCGGGCVRCVYDLHDEALARYEAALAAWRARHGGAAPPDA